VRPALRYTLLLAIMAAFVALVIAGRDGGKLFDYSLF
jgi:hypothetical protein